MNEKNLAYLKDSLRYLGFGESLGEALEARLKGGEKAFTLSLNTEFNKVPFSATLHLNRSTSSDLYFLNKWDAAYGPEGTNRNQTFYLHKGQGITLKEGFNLLNGRAVYKELTDKEGKGYHAWLQLDGTEKDGQGNSKINQYHQNYGYDLENKLFLLPIKGLADPALKDSLIKSLQKGNMQAVTMDGNGRSERVFISANPQYKSLNFHEQDGKQIPAHVIEKRFGLELKEKKSPEVSIIGKPGSTNEKGNEKSLGRGEKPGMSLEKKRSGKRNGYHL